MCPKSGKPILEYKKRFEPPLVPARRGAREELADSEEGERADGEEDGEEEREEGGGDLRKEPSVIRLSYGVFFDTAQLEEFQQLVGEAQQILNAPR